MLRFGFSRFSASGPVLLGGLLFGACGEAPAPDLEEAAEDVSAGALRAREGGTTVWVEPVLARDGDTFTIEGRASRTLVDGFAFVFDDPYGDLRVTSARKFTVDYSTTELSGLTIGTPIFLRLGLKPSVGRADTLTARVTARPILTEFAGSGVYLDDEVRVVSYGGRPMVELRGRLTRGSRALEVFAANLHVPDVVFDGTSFRAYLLLDHVHALAGTDQALRFVTTGSRDREKTVRLELELATLELTSADPYEVWPTTSCDPDVAACLATLESGTHDLSSCGTYREVIACPRATAAVVDDAAFQRAVQLAYYKPRSDAAALVGEARADSFLGNLEMSAEAALEPYYGRVYATEAERDGALADVVLAVVDGAYARPLELVEPLEPIPGDLAQAREIAADAFLADVAPRDLVASEWGRPLEVLTRQFRDRHLASLRELRTGTEIAAESPSAWTFVVDWLDAMVEVSVDKRTGAATRVLFEID